MLPIVDITKFTFQDFPGYTSCIIWFAGCNFRCPYCHNPEFINNKQTIIPENNVFDFLKTRIGLLDGVVLSGGECCLNNELYNFIQKIKKMGFLIKIDTNGTNFELIKKLIENNLVDFIALDYKAPKEKFELITKNNNFDNFEKTLNFLIEKNISMEVRTTIHTQLLDENDINKIIIDLKNRNYNKTYHIQNFRNDNKNTLENLPEQDRILDKTKINNNGIQVFFRNFF